MTQQQHYHSFDPSWLSVLLPDDPLACDAPYLSILSESNTFQWLALLLKHLKSAKHYKRYGLLMRAYRLERGDFEGDDCDANTMTTPSNLPLTHDKTTTTRRRYPDSWLQQTPLPSKLDHQQVSYGERIYDHVSKTLRWRCLLCDSGWMGNSGTDAMEHCAGRNMARITSSFGPHICYMRSESQAAAREAAEQEVATKQAAEREQAAERQAVERLQQQRLQQQQQDILKRQHAPMEPAAAKEALQKVQQERHDNIHGQ
ncbi:hypothetical protein MPSEU_001007900 [Mayamaea pseudoterrestris]|nr:hypothetical protein MPSEU_001007900 [Mayamaea pseudoterrestris]